MLRTCNHSELNVYKLREFPARDGEMAVRTDDVSYPEKRSAARKNKFSQCISGTIVAALSSENTQANPKGEL